jgi:type I restriction enzyme S subunit
MASEIKSLVEIVKIKGGKRLPKGESLQTDENKHPYIRVRDMGGRYIPKNGLEYVPENIFPKISRYIVEENDVIISIVGTVGLVSIIDKYFHKASQTENCAKLSGLSEVDAKYLYYYLISPCGQQEISTYTVGAVQPKLPLYGIESISVPWFKESKRAEIAHILGSLDDKIELNRQMNETLEAMAQALFTSWFIDFDPVIDNALAAGNAIPDELLERAEQRKSIKKKDNTEIQNLFPNEFELTEEMGWIPKGWQELQIKDIAKVVKGKSYKSSELAESQTALVTLKSFKRGGGYRLDGLKEYTGKYKEEQEVKAGDLVVAYTDVTQAADLIGKPAMVIDDIRYKHLVISLDVAVVRPEIDSQKYYLYGLAQTEAFQSHNYSHSTGTTVLHLSKNAVPNYYLCLPSENLLHGFTKIVEPLFTSVNNNIGEIRNLEKLRDTLLPKLMSGELHIADAAALIDEAI